MLWALTPWVAAPWRLCRFNIKASPGDDWDNPLRHLLATATPDDYVLFKLDIDTNEVEEAIVRSILAR